MILHRELMRFSFVALRQNRKFLYALLVSLVPLLFGIIMFANDITQQNKGGHVFQTQFTQPVIGLILAFTVPFVALLLAGGMIADEVEDRTLTYLLVRPIPRRVLYASKAAPVIAAAAALAGLQVLLFGIMRLLSALAFGATVHIPYALLAGPGPTALDVRHYVALGLALAAGAAVYLGTQLALRSPETRIAIRLLLR
ncbi:MAG: ABC transporter permease, partial [Thermoplasmatota archaeon]